MMYQISMPIEVSYQEMKNNCLLFKYNLGNNCLMLLNTDFEYSIYNLLSGQVKFNGVLPETNKEWRGTPAYINWFDIYKDSILVYTSLKESKIKFFDLNTKSVVREIPLGFHLNSELFHSQFCRVLDNGNVVAAYRNSGNQMTVYLIDPDNKITKLGEPNIKQETLFIEHHGNVVLFCTQNKDSETFVLNYVCNNKLSTIEVKVDPKATIVKVGWAFEKFLYLFYNRLHEKHSGLYTMILTPDMLANGQIILSNKQSIQQNRLFDGSLSNLKVPALMPESMILASTKTMLVWTISNIHCYRIDPSSDVMKIQKICELPIGSGDDESDADFFGAVRGEGLIEISSAKNKVKTLSIRRVSLSAKRAFYFWMFDQAGLNKVFNHTDVMNIIECID
jgi:hypothetical protein